MNRKHNNNINISINISIHINNNNIFALVKKTLFENLLSSALSWSRSRSLGLGLSLSRGLLLAPIGKYKSENCKVSTPAAGMEQWQEKDQEKEQEKEKETEQKQ
ncbi:GH24328 [Drosophila grimshawi]|uniref:GH24328 n=1 Tax=Drosophila grimshawi TaxID=7222 RepID=B4JMH3_DROGR|nr:GH24328 [Drosophila grimshawi]